MKFENVFSRPGKDMDFRENGRGHGKVMEFPFFGPKISCCLKTGKIHLVTEQKYGPEGHEKVMEKSLNFIAQFLYEPCPCSKNNRSLFHFLFL